MLRRSRGEGEHRRPVQPPRLALIALASGLALAFPLSAAALSSPPLADLSLALDAARSRLSTMPASPESDALRALVVDGERLLSRAAGAQREVASATSARDAAALELDAARVARSSARAVVLDATTALAAATAAYAESRVPDPDWVPETHEVTYVELVERTVTTRVEVGLAADVFDRRGFDEAPPLPAKGEAPAWSSTVSSVDFQWGLGPVLGSGLSEDVLARFAGPLLVQQDAACRFYAPADDGVVLRVDGVPVILDWVDKGGGGSVSEPVSLSASAGSELELFYYENGGGAHVALLWACGDAALSPVPPSAFARLESSTVVDRVEWTVVEVVPGQVHPLVRDASLLPAVESAAADLASAESRLTPLVDAEASAVLALDREDAVLSVASSALDALLSDAVVLARDVRAVPDPAPVPEPSPAPEPSPIATVEPTPEPLPEPESPPEIFVLAALGDALEALSNLGKDMSPEVRERAQEVVVTAVVVNQVVQSAVAAAASASASASAAASASAGRRPRS